MNSTGSETLDRIQQEIKESLQREEELRKKYQGEPPEKPQNGYSSAQPVKVITTNVKNGAVVKNSETGRLFAPNSSSKGVMQKFLKMRGKLSLVNLKPSANPSQQAWISDDAFTPAKISVEAGKSIRNGFVPAEEKMRRELQEFQKREDELRKERRKSQPDLMAALEAENESNLKPARSTALMYSSDDLTEDSFSSGAGSLKPTKSLAELCDASDDELETPGTHSLIMQFESMKNQARS